METANLDIIRERLAERLHAVRKSGREVSRAAGYGLSYVNDIIAGKSKEPAEKRLEAVADVLECDVGYLLGRQEKPRKAGRHAPEVVDLSSRRPLVSAGIPSYSADWPTADGFFTVSKAMDYVAPHIAGGYTVMVPDDSMSPRFRAGERIFTNPHRPPSIGSYVFVKLIDGRTLICEVAAIAPDRVEVTRFADSEKRTLKRDEIVAIHRITASSED